MLLNYKKGYNFSMYQPKSDSLYLLEGWYLTPTGKIYVKVRGPSLRSCVANLMLTENEFCHDDARFMGGWVIADCDVTTMVRDFTSRSSL